MTKYPHLCEKVKGSDLNNSNAQGLRISESKSEFATILPHVEK